MENTLIISSILLWVLVLFNFVLLLATIRRIGRINNTNMIEGLKPGTIAPKFRARSLSDNKIINNKEYDNKDVAFIAIGIDCQPCHELMPHLASLYSFAKERNVEIVLTSESNSELTNTYLSKFNNLIPTLIVERQESNFMQEYNILGTPFYCLVNNKGTVFASGHPGLEANDLRAQINALKESQ